MPEYKHCKLPQPPRSSDKKKRKKRKKRKKPSSSTSPPENTDNPQAASLPPETPLVSLLAPQSPGRSPGQLPKLRTASKKGGERRAGSSRRSTKHLKESPTPLTVTNKTRGGGDGGVTVQGYVAELSTRARDSLRWEGALEDPQAEEERMELYRANRRQRYVSHREALLKESPCALRQTFPKESKLIGSDQQEQRLN